MQKIIQYSCLIFTVLLVGCTGPGEAFEPTTYGVRNSRWSQMTEAQQIAERQFYMQEQLLAEQRRANNLLAQQNQELKNSNRESNQLLREKIILDRYSKQSR